MPNPKKILITGASGLLGHVLTPWLRQSGVDVVTQGYRNAVGADVSADTADTVQCHAMLDLHRPQVIVNLVACTDVDACERDPGLAYRLNATSVETLAWWIKRADGRHLVHISTDQVYDGQGPHREEDARPVNEYGRSKIAGENAALSVGASVLRTNFFGPSMLARRTSYSDWLIIRLREGKNFPVFEDVQFSPLAMTSLVRAISRVIERPKAGVFNLGSRGGMTKAEFALRLAAHLSLDPAPINPVAMASLNLTARRPLDMRLDCRRFEEAFDFALPTTQEEIGSLEPANAPTQ